MVCALAMGAAAAAIKPMAARSWGFSFIGDCRSDLGEPDGESGGSSGVWFTKLENTGEEECAKPKDAAAREFPSKLLQ